MPHPPHPLITTISFVTIILLTLLTQPSSSQCPITTHQPDIYISNIYSHILIDSLLVTNQNLYPISVSNITISSAQDVKTFSHSLAKPFTMQPHVATSISDFAAQFAVDLFLSVKPYFVGDSAKRLNSLNFIIRTEWKYTVWKKIKFGFVAEERSDIESGVYQIQTNVLDSFQQNKQLQLYFPFQTVFGNSPSVVTFLTGFEISSKQANGYYSPLQIQQSLLSRNKTGFSLSLTVTSNTLVSQLVVSYVAFDSRLVGKVIGSTLVYDDFQPKSTISKNMDVSVTTADMREVLTGINGFIFLLNQQNSEILFETSFSPGSKDFTWTSTTSMLYLAYSYFVLVGNKCSICEGYPYFYAANCVASCPIETFLLSDTCVSCPSSTAWNGTFCITVCSGGRLWNSTTQSCQCPMNTFWNSTSCATCPFGQYFNTLANQCQCITGNWNGTRCLMCVSNQFWNTYTLACECQASSYWNDTLCVICPERTFFNASLKTCVCSQTNKQYNPTTNSCQCITGYQLQSNGSCTLTCSTGQFFNGTQCISTCPVNSYYNGTVCLIYTPSCPSGTQWSVNQCITPIPSCPQGMTWTGKCCISSQTKCIQGYYYWNGQACVALSQRCPYLLEWRNSMCLPVTTNCPVGAYFNGYLCVFYDQCANNMVWNATLVKCVCVEGAFWNGEKCLKCDYGMVYTGDGCVCLAGTAFNGTTCTSLSNKSICKSINRATWNGTHCICFPGYSSINDQCICFGLEMTGWCNRCYQKPNSFYSNNICTCLQGYIQYNNSCIKPQSLPQAPSRNITVSNQSSPCSVSTFWDSQLKQCLPCTDGCLSCINCYKCIQCQVGFVYNPVTQLCDQICGDGKRFKLQCDDGNNINGDGCSMDCKVENGFTCTGGSPNSKDSCSQFVPTEISLLQTGQSHLFGKIILNVQVNYLPTNLTSILLGCRQSCLSLLNATVSQTSQSPTQISTQYIGGAFNSISITIDFKKEPIEKFIIDLSINSQIRQKYFPSIVAQNGLKLSIEPKYLTLVIEKDYVR